MAFNGQALNEIFDWWFYHGNPKISIWLDYGGELFFYNTDRAERVARVVRLGDGPYFLSCNAKGDPFTGRERQEIEKFVRANNAKLHD